MIFNHLPIAGCRLIVPEIRRDARGSFTRIFCASEFREAGINFMNEQLSLSANVRKGTLRGMHLQQPPYAEAKIVRCTKGSIYDVMLDLRPGSATYLRWHAVTLSSENQLAVFIPEGCAHGFQALEDGSEVHYQISVAYSPESARGFRWNDPSFGIHWPILPPFVSDRDEAFALYRSATSQPGN